MLSILREPSSWIVDKLEKEERIIYNKLLLLVTTIIYSYKRGGDK